MRLCKHGFRLAAIQWIWTTFVCCQKWFYLLNTFLTTTMESYFFLVISSLSVVQLCCCCFQTEKLQVLSITKISIRLRFNFKKRRQMVEICVQYRRKNKYLNCSGFSNTYSVVCWNVEPINDTISTLNEAFLVATNNKFKLAISTALQPCVKNVQLYSKVLPLSPARKVFKRKQ